MLTLLLLSGLVRHLKDLKMLGFPVKLKITNSKRKILL